MKISICISSKSRYRRAAEATIKNCKGYGVMMDIRELPRMFRYKGLYGHLKTNVAFMNKSEREVYDITLAIFNGLCQLHDYLKELQIHTTNLKSIKTKPMLHICKSEKTGEFIVVDVDHTNGEVLTSSQLLSSKAKAFQNINAQRKSWPAHGVYVQDDTPKKSVIYFSGVEGHDKLSEDEVEERDMKIMPKHIIGKKPKKK